MTSNRITTVFITIIIIIIIGLTVYYFMPQEKAVNYFEFTIMDQELPQDKIDKYTNRFNEATLALKEDPDDFNSWLSLASAKKQVGDYKGAEEIWIHAGEIRPLNSTSFANLANLYAYFLIDYDKAEEAYFKAIENSSGEEVSVIHYSNFYQFYLYQLKDFDKAEAILLESIVRNSNRSDLPATAGYFYKDQGDIQKAIEYFTKSLEINPDNAQVKTELEKLK